MRWLCTDEDTDRVAVTISIITPGIWLGFAVGGLTYYASTSDLFRVSLGILGIAVALFTAWLIVALRKPARWRLRPVLEDHAGKLVIAGSIAAGALALSAFFSEPWLLIPLGALVFMAFIWLPLIGWPRRIRDERTLDPRLPPSLSS